MDNFKKAKMVLHESGFIPAFYYIRKIQEGNVNSKNVRHETATRAWGMDILRRLEKDAKKKHPKLKYFIEQVTNPYFDEISSRHYEIIDNILENKAHGDSEQEANDSN